MLLHLTAVQCCQLALLRPNHVITRPMCLRHSMQVSNLGLDNHTYFILTLTLHSLRIKGKENPVFNVLNIKQIMIQLL